MLSLILLLLVVIFLISGIITLAEGVVISFSDEKDEYRSVKKQKNIKRIEYFHDEFTKIYSYCELSKLILAIMGILMVETLLDNYFLDEGYHLTSLQTLAIKIAASVLMGIPYWIFSIQVPRALGEKYWYKLTGVSAFVLGFIEFLLKIPFAIISAVSGFFLKLFKAESKFSVVQISQEQIKDIIEAGVESGAIDESDREIINNVFEFIDMKAREVMVPRTEMVAVELTGNNEKDFKEIINTGYSLIPVYKDSLDNIVGIAHVKDIVRQLTTRKTPDISTAIRPAFFVPENKFISEILSEMQKRGERITIVTDEYGGTEGVITLEDIISEIVGDINDPGVQKEYTESLDGNYVVFGSINIEDLNEAFNLDLPLSEDYNTLAGFILFNTGKILNPGDKYRYENIEFELIKKVKQKMVQFKMTMNSNSAADKE
ncbi:MAG: hemolysin family protein [Ignavibacteriaceae bacterium]|nr:hemolysin family protein [Ignavibacteriaceae bacterium]